MNREKYISELEKQNGYCECPQLQGLYDLRKEVERLDLKCASFKRELGNTEELREDNSGFVFDYKGTFEEFKRAAEVYYEQLTLMMRNNELFLMLHDEKSNPKKISLEEIAQLQNKNSAYIATIHCAGCNQQIDLVDSYA